VVLSWWLVGLWLKALAYAQVVRTTAAAAWHGFVRDASSAQHAVVTFAYISPGVLQDAELHTAHTLLPPITP